jgi:single-strand DNA-binding protein
MLILIKQERSKKMNIAILLGRLVKDPEFSQTQSGIPMCRFRIAVDKPYAKKDEEKANFFSCIAWRKTAEFISTYFKKGQRIILHGSIENANYTDNNGVKHYADEIQVDKAEFADTKTTMQTNQPNNTNGQQQPPHPQNQPYMPPQPQNAYAEYYQQPYPQPQQGYQQPYPQQPPQQGYSQPIPQSQPYIPPQPMQPPQPTQINQTEYSPMDEEIPT